jgi:hypothetical protein
MNCFDGLRREMLNAWDAAGKAMDQITAETSPETKRQLIRKRKAAQAVLASLSEWQEQERAAAFAAAAVEE